MDNYLNRVQWTQLLAAINPNRVATKDGQSNVEAYDIRAHLNRIFGFARWSDDLLDLVMLYEQSKGDGPEPRWRAAYRATVRLTVNAPDGTQLATYTAAAVGTNFGWLPDSKRDDAHDMAIKTASSQALKRCAIDLGDQFGLSLYRKGSVLPLVGGTIVAPKSADPNGERGETETRRSEGEEHQDVTAHITEPLAPEDETPAPPAEPATADTPTGQDTTPQWATIIRDRVVKEAPTKQGNARKTFLLRQLTEAGNKSVLGAPVVDGEGNGTFLDKLIESALRAA